MQLLPWPQSIDLGSGSTQLESSLLQVDFVDVESSRLQSAVIQLGEELACRTSLAAKPEPTHSVHINCAELSSKYPGIEEDESHWLVVDDAGIYLDAATELGALRGLTTLGQLVDEQGRVPHLAIDDRPRFAWRGLMLDPARHFLPVEAICRTLDGMSLCKLNVLHLHLSDDQGFRLPVDAFPALMSDPGYSVDDLQRIVEHAAGYGIRVVPEIDMPGHVTSWLDRYPEWGVRQVSPSTRFGVHEACLDPTSERVYEAIDEILGALSNSFPDPCVHIGGDEVSPVWWSADPKVKALMEREGLRDIRDVQAYFNHRVGDLVKKRGKQLIAWDEVQHRDLPEEWIVQAWRGATARDRALAHGNRVVLSAPYYLDLNYPADVHYAFDPSAAQREHLELEDTMLDDHRFSHVAEGMRWTRQWRAEQVELDSEGSTLLGAEACLWGELVTDDVLDVRLWSRLPALAERFWTATSERTSETLYDRLKWYLQEIHPLRGRDLNSWAQDRLRELGVDSSCAELIAMIEPVKWYGRLLGREALDARIKGEEMPQSRPYSVATVLGGIADHLPPESFRSRELSVVAERCSQGDPDAAGVLTKAAQQWQLLAAQDLTVPQELNVLRERLGMLGEAVLARLERQQLTDAQTFAAITEPQGELMIAIGAELRAWLMTP